eukprot:4991132-Lingulodinium_polyedra.AAC.1
MEAGQVTEFFGSLIEAFQEEGFLNALADVLRSTDVDGVAGDGGESSGASETGEDLTACSSE